jgi:hypothetical protein
VLTITWDDFPRELVGLIGHDVDPDSDSLVTGISPPTSNAQENGSAIFRLAPSAPPPKSKLGFHPLVFVDAAPLSAVRCHY